MMQRLRRHNGIALGLYLNAALLACVLVALLSRDDAPPVLPAAYAQQANIAGGGGIYIMPGQLSGTTFGCYLLDSDAQTLCVYQFAPGERELRLLAARSVRFDRRLNNFNTTPAPQVVQDLLNREAAGIRGRPDAPPEPPSSPEAPIDQ